MSKREVRIYCEDCPLRSFCEEHDHCDWARSIAKMVADAPPLSQSQIDKIVALLGGPRR